MKKGRSNAPGVHRDTHEVRRHDPSALRLFNHNRASDIGNARKRNVAGEKLKVSKDAIADRPTAIRVQINGVLAGIKLLALALRPAGVMLSCVDESKSLPSVKSFTDAHGIAPCQYDATWRDGVPPPTCFDTAKPSGRDSNITKFLDEGLQTFGRSVTLLLDGSQRQRRGYIDLIGLLDKDWERQQCDPLLAF